MIDIEALLQPISDENPAGEDISFSHEFDLIQEARRSDDASLSQGEWVTEIKQADWAQVAKRCTDLLQHKSKDLRLAAWLAEAASHLHGFSGLTAGYQLIAGLCNTFWDTMHPEIEDGDIDLRVGNLRWMLTQSQQWLLMVPLTQTAETNYAARDVETAVRSQNATIDMADIDSARAATSITFYQQLANDIPLVQQALAELESIIDAQLGEEGPSFSAVRDTLETVTNNAERLITAAGAMPTDHTASDAEAPTSEDTPQQAANQPTGNKNITTRQEALQQLQRVADFFKRTEPHNPVTYLAERAVKWGNMPLHTWLQAVLKEESGALSHLEELLGFAEQQGDD